MFCWFRISKRLYNLWIKCIGSGHCETMLNIPHHMVWCPKGINWLMCTSLQWQIIFCKLISKWRRICIATPRSSIQIMVGTLLIKLTRNKGLRPLILNWGGGLVCAPPSFKRTSSYAIPTHLFCNNITWITQPCIHTYRNINGLWQPPWCLRLKKSC